MVSKGITDRLVAVGTGLDGKLLLFDLSSRETRSKGPVLTAQLPSATGGVTACSFAPAEEPSGMGAGLDQFGVMAGGSTGEVVCFDLRKPGSVFFY